MGATCSSCCSSKSPDNYTNITDSSNANQMWIQAVTDNHTMGCKFILADDPSVIDEVIDFKTGKRAIHIATEHRNQELIKCLCSTNVDINAQTRDTKDTALHFAARLNDTSLIKLLLSHGIDYTIQNKKGKLAKDLCNSTFRREFNPAKIERLVLDQKKEEFSISGINLEAVTQNGYDRSDWTKESIEWENKLEDVVISTEKTNANTRNRLWEKFDKHNKGKLDSDKYLRMLLYSLVALHLKAKDKSQKAPGKKALDPLLLELCADMRPLLKSEDDKYIEKNDFIENIHEYLRIVVDNRTKKQQQQEDLQ